MRKLLLGLLLVGLVMPVLVRASPRVTAADTNCSDFSTQAHAQQYFNSHGGSPSNNVDGLDRDHDGIACESNPCPCSTGRGGGGSNPSPSPAPRQPSLFRGKCRRGPHPDPHCTPGAVFSSVTADDV